MAHFYANIQGNRGEATRMGSKDSGIRGHIRGWDIGGSVWCRHYNGKDRVTLTVTSGSNGGARGHLPWLLRDRRRRRDPAG